MRRHWSGPVPSSTLRWGPGCAPSPNPRSAKCSGSGAISVLFPGGLVGEEDAAALVHDDAEGADADGDRG